MNAQDYQQLALRTEAEQAKIAQRRIAILTDHPGAFSIWGVQASRLQNAITGLTDEAGELNGLIKRWIEYGKPITKTEVLDECGDVLWRVTQALAAVGHTLEDAMQANIRKLAARYPEGFSDFLAQEENRNRDAERVAIENNTMNRVTL